MVSHLQSSMRLHLDIACVKLDNTDVEMKNTKAKLNDAHKKLYETQVKLNETQVKLNETQVKLNATEEKLEETRKVVEKLETRIFIWKINNFSVIVKKEEISKDSVPFYTDRTGSLGYKLKLRIYPKIRSSDCGHLLLGAIVIMKGEYDAILAWPFKMKVNLTLIDQQEDPVKRENVTRLLNLDFNQKALARPVKEENEECIILNLDHKTLHSRRYLANDTLFIQAEVSPP